ncbi:unnamed protein product [Heligmosomoides polygyrus]|uniref:Secreted protein n=1 Tax=Heligmosomoides polygyrus TaxID=6339 RepID=A0A183FJZ2_HELPZ|nr:unnamed protein product [Heligmosomoides polygyrus]
MFSVSLTGFLSEFTTGLTVDAMNKARFRHCTGSTDSLKFCKSLRLQNCVNYVSLSDGDGSRRASRAVA